MSTELNTDVLIVGAGPAGLMSANQLNRFGIDFIIVDTKSEPTEESRALLVTSRSMEVYQQLGLSDGIVAEGKKMTSVNIYSRGKSKGSVNIGEIGEGLSEFGYLMTFEQSKNERTLADNLENNGIKIHWEHEFIEMLTYEDEVKSKVMHGAEEVLINSKYIIGCEGAKSPIRHQLNFSFKGGTYEQKFFVADTLIEWDLGFNKLVLAPGSENFCAMMPINQTATYRVIGTLPRGLSKQEDITFRDIEAVVKSTLGIPIEFKEVNWFSIYKLHHRSVDHFSEGRVFLAGDSAHIHSPAGGQGMNTGLQDASNLAWKLALVLKNQADKKLLDTYNEERLPIAHELLKFTDRGFSFMSSHKWYIRFFRTYIALSVVGVVVKMKRIKPILFKTLSQIGYGYRKSSLSLNLSRQKLKFKAGDRLPYFGKENIYPKLNGACFYLIHINKTEMEPSMKNDIIENFAAELEVFEDHSLSKWQEVGVQNELFILIRPDHYIGYMTDSFDKEQFNTYLQKIGL